MSKRKRRWSSDFKAAAVARMESAATIGGLAEELGICRELLFKWRRAQESGGGAALRPPGRARKSAIPPENPVPPDPVGADLPAARRRIEELERKIGRQQLDLDFFRAALRRVRDEQPKTGGPGETTSSR